jgi:hypothetical protein
MFMRYSGEGLGHQHEGSRWKSADRGSQSDEIIVDSDPEDDANVENNTSNAAKLHAFNMTLAHLKANEDEGAETDDSSSAHSSRSDSSEEPSDHDTDDDEDDRAYFGPEDREPIYDYDSDGM